MRFSLYVFYYTILFHFFFQIRDPFQVLVAANRAIHLNRNNKMMTKNVHSEILFCLSPTKNVSSEIKQRSYFMVIMSVLKYSIERGVISPIYLCKIIFIEEFPSVNF